MTNKKQDRDDVVTREETEKTALAQGEEQVLAFWEKESIFQKSIDTRQDGKEFVFFDGPPFATGLPHYGHLLPGTIKDVIPRYQTMRGHKVLRHWGWDCHGLPIENIVEKKLNLNSRKDIIEYGIDAFNKEAAETVLTYKDDWEKVIPRTGRWVDMKKHYKTMDPSYTESVWWAFKRLHEKGLIYKGFKAMQLCPRCETTLSNNEVAEGYKVIKDLSVTARFPLTDNMNVDLLAWTTTPWTLPGNVAIAVHRDIDYVQVKAGEREVIVAKARLEDVMAQAGIEGYQVTAEFKGESLIGKSYIPPFDYYISNLEIENHDKGWKVYHADFVTDESGTGIAHEAPAFGAEDMQLGQENNLPFIQHVTRSGHFKPEVADFAGMLVKSVDDHMATDIEIVKWLAHNDRLFSKEKIEHSYPHCWRCKTPLLNYAADSWFVETTKLRKRMLEENEKVGWVPDHIGHKRFANWIENNVDWAISRSRFWGAPLPVWESTTGKQIVVGSLQDLKSYTTSTNNIVLMRHARSVANDEGVICSTIGHEMDTLSDEGKNYAEQSVMELSKTFADAPINNGDQVDMVFCSPFLRTEQTAEIVAKGFGLAPEQIIVDDRLSERNFGDLDGKPYNDYLDYLVEGIDDDSNFTKQVPGGESPLDVKIRMMEFLYDIDAKYQDKNILIVTHFTPLWSAVAGAQGLGAKGSSALRQNWGHVQNAKPLYLDFAPFPHNDEYVLDFHRPYIDDVVITKDEEEYRVIGEVFDCWFESGSMPYASVNFTGQAKRPERYPANFISEGLDQTRGWFYTLMALGVGLFDKSPYNNVIVHGVVLAEDGRKMSKSLNNYPPVETIINKYGADALRFYLVNSPAMRGDSVNLSEKGIDEVVKKIILRTKNILSFYTMYAQDIPDLEYQGSDSPLDRWIIARLAETHAEVTKGLDEHHLDRACAPINLFVDDFSTWYVRRSRERYKSDDPQEAQESLATTGYVLKEFSKLLAPFMPFLAEQLWQALKTDSDEESVHLSYWTDMPHPDEQIINQMAGLRALVTDALDLRSKEKIKVRQPLASLSVADGSVLADSQMIEILRDELNVKEIIIDPELDQALVLDTKITPELAEEGEFRELLRSIQSERKKTGLEPKDRITLTLADNDAMRSIAGRFSNELESVAGVSQITYDSAIDEFAITKQ